MNIMSRSSVWKPRVKLISALENSGIKEYWNDVLEYIELTKTDDYLVNKRLNQNKKWLNNLFFEMIKSKISQDPELQKSFKELEHGVIQNKSTPFKSAEKMLKLLFTSHIN